MQIAHPSPDHRRSPAQTSARMRERQLLRVLLLGATLAALLLSAVAALVGAGPVLTVAIVAIFIVIILRWPVAGAFILLAAVVLVDENNVAYSILTNQLYVYSWPSGLEGFIERPIGLLM